MLLFKPFWNKVAGDEIVLSWTVPVPDADDWQHRQFIDYHGEKRSVPVLVARNLGLIKAGTLRCRSLRALALFHDQLFRLIR
jgi:hypothetical protein